MQQSALAAKARAQADDPLAGHRQARVWPGLLIVASFWAFRFGLRSHLPKSWLNPTTTLVIVSAALALVVWWLFFSRLRALDRWLGLIVLVVGGAIALPLIHDSLKQVQRDGVAMLAVPVVITAMVGWLAAARLSPARWRTAGLVAVGVAVWAGFLLVRIKDRGGWADIQWRLSPTAEQKLLAQRIASGKMLETASVGPLVVESGDWPEFRGSARDNRVSGVRIETDWQKHPPKLLWKHAVGPGWSSFSVVGEVCFTQEQRGDEETTTCYRVDTGAEVWAHGDPARFDDPMTGAGPRGVPTFRDGKLYTVGATGLVDCLDATSGRLLWQRSLPDNVGTKLQEWGIATSPLVVDHQAVVFAGGGDGKGTIAYDAASGEPVWTAGRGTHSFSSPQLAEIGGVRQILMAHDLGLDALDPATGKLLWQHDWSLEGNGRMLQPYVLGGDRVVLASGYNQGTRLLKIAHTGDDWQVEELWTSKDLVPYYSDFVVYQDHAYGFDGGSVPVFCCIDLATGGRKWKKGRYGFGQVLLLADQGLLLVISEDGELVLIGANPEKLNELAKFHVLDGRSGNHPVVAGGKLLVRNAEEMACYELPLEQAAQAAVK